MSSNPIAIFMSDNNRLYLTKTIYVMHKDLGGTLPYTHFKSVMYKQMEIWLKSIKIRNGITPEDLNTEFLRKNAYICEPNVVNGINLESDTNVYRLGTNITSYDENDNIISEVKSFKNLMAADYGSINVWKDINITTNPTKYRNGNRIPNDRISRHIRNNDRNPGGYQTSADKSSLNNLSRGYGNAMSELIKKNDELRKKQTQMLL